MPAYLIVVRESPIRDQAEMETYRQVNSPNRPRMRCYRSSGLRPRRIGRCHNASIRGCASGLMSQGPGKMNAWSRFAA
jgi:hypothetical protein